MFAKLNAITKLEFLKEHGYGLLNFQPLGLKSVSG
jgi:hypothetical protein